MPNFICTTCGVQYADSDRPPASCLVCQDERQYVKVTGQQWTTLERLRLTNGGAGGALLTGDIIQVVPDRKHVSFMYSYPNHIPLPASSIEGIIKAVEPFEYERVYGAFWDMVIEHDGKARVSRASKFSRSCEFRSFHKCPDAS